MSEYIVRETAYPGAVKQEVVGEIVRCKDCKWRDEPGCALRIVDESDKPKDNGFCSFGERRTDDTR